MRRSWSISSWFRAISVPISLRAIRSEEHTSELQSRLHLVCRLLLEKKKKPHAREALVRNSIIEQSLDFAVNLLVFMLACVFIESYGPYLTEVYCFRFTHTSANDDSI